MKILIKAFPDEEDFNVDLRDNCVSLGGPLEKEEVVQLQSRLDILKGALRNRSIIL